MITRNFNTIVHGYIEQVYPDSMTMLVRPEDNGPTITVAITSPAMGPDSGMFTMPQRGGVVVLAVSDRGEFIPVQFRRTSRTHNYDVVNSADNAHEYNDLEDAMLSQIPVHFRKMQEGDTRVWSSGGSEIYLDHDIEFIDGSMNSIRLRSDDGSYIVNAINSHGRYSGVLENKGFAIRNKVSSESGGDGYFTHTHFNGTKNTYIGDVPDISNTASISLPLTEYRLDVADQADPYLDIDEVISGNLDKSSSLNPSVTFVLANLIGNDSDVGKQYAKPLVPLVADNLVFDENYAPRFRVINVGDESSKFGVSWGFKAKDHGLVMQDKEGVLHTVAGRSTRRDMKGASSVTRFRGSEHKWVGANSDKGGISSDVTYEGTSSKVVNSSGVPRFDTSGFIMAAEYTDVRGRRELYVNTPKRSLTTMFSKESLPKSDVNNIQDLVLVRGSARHEYSGRHELKSGSFLHEVDAAHLISASSSRLSAAFKNEIIGMDMDVSALSKMNMSSGALGFNVLSGGKYVERVILGDRTFDLLRGDFSVTSATGGIKEVVALSRSTKAGGSVSSDSIGSFSVKSGSGIEMSTLGEFNAKSSAFNVNALSVDIKAAKVGIGPGVRSNALTSLTAPCFISGLIHPGNPTVQIG